MVLIRKCIEALDELQDQWNNNWYSKGKQKNKLWRQLSDTLINTKLNLKTRFVWEKKNLIKISGAILFEVQARVFVQLITFQAISSIFIYFMMSSQVLMKQLTCTLIHVRKIFNCRVSFKMLLSMCLMIFEKELRTYHWPSNFQNGTFEKLPQEWRTSFSFKRTFLPLVLRKKNKNENTEYHSIFIPFKSQVYKTRQSYFSLVRVKPKFFQSNLTNLADVQRCLKTIYTAILLYLAFCSGITIVDEVKPRRGYC